MVENQKLITDLKSKFDDSKDFIIHQFEYYDQDIFLLYIETLCNDDKIKKDIIEPLLMCEKETKFTLHLLSLPSCKKVNEVDDLETLLFKGRILIFISNSIYSYDVANETNEESLETVLEMSVQGPQKGLSENLNKNITFIRNRYPSPNLTVENQTVGTISKTPIAILYDQTLFNEDILKDLKKRISQIDMDVIQAAGQLQNALTRKKHHLFPLMLTTERPDRIALNLSQGKIVVLLKGTPFGLIVPVTFFDFISAMDDLSHAYWVKMLMVWLRYIGLAMTLILPSLYVAITSYNPEIVRSQLALTIAGSREAVPYPSFFEVIFMLLAVEMLVESSIRLPKAIGPTATTVGGLILGEAAQQAQLVSSIMIIIVAFVAIANFTIPINAMSFAIRCARYPLILLATFFGVLGVVAGMILLLCYLCDLRSMNQPYLKLSWGASKKIEEISENQKEGSS